MNNSAPPEIIHPRKPGAIRLLQLTDCHIFAEAETCLRGMNTRGSLQAVCRHVDANHSGFDALLATGDLSQDGSAESYQYLAAVFDGMKIPVFWLPGNHDDTDVMAAYFQAQRISPAKQVLIENWQIVLLDSTIKGEIHGRVAPAQLEFLDHALQEFPDKHALVCLHHQALDVGSQWIDAKGLQQSAELRARLAQHVSVRGVLWGHVHQELHLRIDGVEWMSTPSTCIQFTPGIDAFGIDDQPPGYRVLYLQADGAIESSVERVENFITDVKT